MSTAGDAWQLEAARAILNILVSAEKPLTAHDLYPCPRNPALQSRRARLLEHLVALGIVNKQVEPWGETRSRIAFFRLKPVAQHRVEEVLTAPGDTELARALWPTHDETSDLAPYIAAKEGSNRVEIVESRDGEIVETEDRVDPADVMGALANRLGQFLDVLERVDGRLAKLEESQKQVVATWRRTTLDDTFRRVDAHLGELRGQVARVSADVLHQGHATRTAFEESANVDIEPTHKVALDTRTLANSIECKLRELAKRPALDVAGLNDLLSTIADSVGVRVRTDLQAASGEISAMLKADLAGHGDAHNAQLAEGIRELFLASSQQVEEHLRSSASLIAQAIHTSFDSLANGMVTRDAQLLASQERRDDDILQAMRATQRAILLTVAADGAPRDRTPNIGMLSAVAPGGKFKRGGE